jgi:putative tributyrin esterase
MAFIDCNFFSETLGMCCSINVILPQLTQNQIGLAGHASSAPPPVLYLLHGLSDDHTIWGRRTSIERYVTQYGLAVVIPNVHRSFYTNMVNGGRYWDFISEELPQIVNSFFNVSTKREDTFVAGLSMGGYGALKLALRQPERFAAAASLSGVLDIVARSKSNDFPELNTLIFNPCTLPGSADDLFALTKNIAKTPDSIPQIYQCCGTEDFLYEDNLRFKSHLENLKISFTYSEAPGTHCWDFWDEHIQNVLKWLPLQNKQD